MNYVITTDIDGVPHGVESDTKAKKFVLRPLHSVTDVHKVMNLPQLSLARTILDWILRNEKKLSQHQVRVSIHCETGQGRRPFASGGEP